MPLLANCLAVHQKASTSTKAKDANHESIERVGPSALRSRAKALAWGIAPQHATGVVLNPEPWNHYLGYFVLFTVEVRGPELRTGQVHLSHGEHSCSGFIRPRSHLSVHNMV